MDRKAFLAKYGSVLVKFDSYYKYMFTYKGICENGDKIFVSQGGDASDIYRLTVYPDTERSIDDLYPSSGYVLSEKNGEYDAFGYEY